MEKSGEWVQKNLMNELKQGRDLAKQLQIHLNATSSSHETREFLVHKILTSYDKALAMLGGAGVHVAGEPPQFAGMAVGMLESPRSLSGSPHSDDSDRDFKDQENKDGSKKRKSMPRWTKQVQVCQGTGLEGPLDDGFNWRKYGQKDILGAKYPRGYYRCTHRNAQGCLATKQVQRSDEDPTIFEITYRGTHTCTQGSHLTPPENQADQPILTTDFHPQLIHQPQQSNDNILLSFQTGLKVLTEDSHHRDNTFPSFHFPSTSNTQPEKDNYGFFPSVVENNFPGNFLPSFVSPATSGSNYFSVSPTQMGGYGGTLNLQTSESEPTEIISAPTSSHSDSPTVGLDFPFGQVEFGSNFTFDNPGFFS